VTRIVEDVKLTSFNLVRQLSAVFCSLYCKQSLFLLLVVQESVEIGNVLERMMKLVRKYRVNLDPAFTSLVVSIVLLEGLG